MAQNSWLINLRTKFLHTPVSMYMYALVFVLPSEVWRCQQLIKDTIGLGGAALIRQGWGAGAHL